jgi:hypothetical protein
MLSTQKNPRSSKALVAEVMPDPLNPVMITMSRRFEVLRFRGMLNVTRRLKI